MSWLYVTMKGNPEIEMSPPRAARASNVWWKSITRCRRIPIIFCLALGISCGIKKTVRVPTSPHLLGAKNASLDQMLEMIQNNGRKVLSLSSNGIRVSFTSGKLESGKLQAYRSAPGYILLKRPDFLRLNIQNPVTKTSVLELLSKGDDFYIWYPRDNKFFIGKNSTKDFDLENAPSFSARPIHLFEAIMPPSLPLDQTGLHVAMEEEQDQNEKYYVISFWKDRDVRTIVPIQRFWIERFSLTIAKELTYGANGSVESITRYSAWSQVDGVMLPQSIRLDRPRIGYSIEMQIRSWRLNPDLPDESFVMEPPSGAERVVLKEKKLSE